MPKTTSSTEITIDQIVDRARLILADANKPVALSWLGQELNRSLGTSIRSVLGSRPLTDVLLEACGDEYEVQGYGPHKEIGKRGTWQFSQKYPHFLKEFWENFERPLDEGVRRWILPAGGPKAVDSADVPDAEGAVEIDRHFILDPSIDQSHKGRAIRQSIITWAKAHAIDLELFEAKPKEAVGRSAAERESQSARGVGVTAIKYMIEAVPPEERGRYNISLDLLARLLNLG